MIGTPTRAVNDTRESEQWDEKTKHQVVWRGTITGIFHVERWDWRSNQRDRAAMLGADRDNTTLLPVLVEGGDGKVHTAEVEKGGMVEKWLNIGVIEHVGRLSNSDGTAILRHDELTRPRILTIWYAALHLDREDNVSAGLRSSPPSSGAS